MRRKTEEEPGEERVGTEEQEPLDDDGNDDSS
jgi:hypothetical protein